MKFAVETTETTTSVTLEDGDEILIDQAGDQIWMAIRKSNGAAIGYGGFMHRTSALAYVFAHLLGEVTP